MTTFAESIIPENFLEEFRALQQRVAELETRRLNAENLAAVSSDLGTITSGMWLITDPTTGNLRMVLSGEDLYDLLGIHAHFAGLDDNWTPQIWIDAVAGGEGFAGGNGYIGSAGIQMEGLMFPLTFHATDAAGANGRNAWIGMQLIDGVPALQLLYGSDVTGAELVSNGTFDTSTGWTLDAGLTCDGKLSYSNTAASNAVQSARFAVTALTSYRITADWSVPFGPTPSSIYGIIRWYNAASGGTLILSQPWIYRAGGGFAVPAVSGTQDVLVTAPAGATHAEFYFTFDREDTTGTAAAWVDNLSMKAVSASRGLSFAPNLTVKGGPLVHEDMPVHPDALTAGRVGLYSLGKVLYQQVEGIARVGGFATGRRVGFNISELGGTTFNADGGAVTVTGTVSDRNGVYRGLVTTATSGNRATLTTTAAYPAEFQGDKSPYFYAKLKDWDATKDNYRLFFGLFGTLPTGDTPSNDFSIGFWARRISGTNYGWYAGTNMGSSTPSTFQLASGMPTFSPNTGPNEYELEFKADYAAKKIIFRINSTVAAVTLTEWNGITSGYLQPYIIAQTTVAATKGIYVSRAYWEGE